MTFFEKMLKLVKQFWNIRIFRERRKEYEKSSGIFDDINDKCFQRSVMAIKEKDGNQADAKTERSQNADNSKDNDKSDTQTKAADNKMYELSSEDDVWTIKVSAPKGCSETDFSSDTARAFERIGNVDGSSLQYVMTLRNADISTVESDMKEEVQYL